MAKDDMEVIMYKILKYLYECMKKDISPQLEDFSWDSKLFHIPQNYWCKIIVTLVRKGYITGFKIIDNTKDAPTIQTDRHSRLHLRVYSSWKRTAECRKPKNTAPKLSM